MSTADAVARETAWLTMSGDGLPALLTTAGGRWDVVQAYAPRTSPTRKNQIWVLRRNIRVARSANIRRMPHYHFELICGWTLSSGTGDAESDQQAFDDAIDDVIARIGGQVLDKTHGGAFLSAAEDPTSIDVQFLPAPQSMTACVFEARITYEADDLEFTG